MGDPMVRACRCDGTGKIAYHHELRDSDGNVVQISSGWNPCSCRTGEEPRAGEAATWSTETPYVAAWQSEVGHAYIEVSVSAEVPYSADVHRLHRHGNRYYPTTIDLQCESREMTFLFPEEVRRLSRLLMEAADAAERIDKPDQAACGHWAPCDCEETTQ